MKKNRTYGLIENIGLLKMIKIMRFTIFILFLSLSQAFAVDSYSQQTKLSLDLKNARVEDIIDKIEKNSEFFFMYNKNMIDVDRKVDIQVEEKSVNEVLDKIFANTGITYSIKDRQILLINNRMADTNNESIIQQQKSVSGKVTDNSGAGLPGVSVVVKGTTTGVITDGDGRYSLLKVPENATLVFSFVGMKSQEIPVNGKSSINITMQEEAIGIEEVVAVGYGTMKKSDLTGSISSVKSDAVNLQAIRNPLQGMTGLASGIQVLQSSGAPGSNLNVLIRGGNSISGGNEPIYIIDGFPTSGLEGINPNEIQSIEILKDASSTAIYGSRGANGVVLITTKKGTKGKANVEYNGYLGIQQVSKKLDLLDAKEFATLANVRASNDGKTLYFTDSEIASFSKGTDWQDVIFQLSPVQNHTIKVSGGNEKTLFNVAANYFNQDGIIVNSFYKRYQLKSNFQHKISPNWTISLDNILNRTEGNTLSSDNTTRSMGVLSAALTSPPTLPVYNENGKYQDLRKYVFSDYFQDNPLALAKEIKNINTGSSCLVNLSLEGILLKDFVLKSSVGISYSNTRNDYYSSSKIITTPAGKASISYADGIRFVNENTLTYTKQINPNHNVSGILGLTSETSNSQSVLAQSSGFLNDLQENYSLQSGSTYVVPTSGYTDYTLLSYLGRLNYSYKSKYLFSASLRADGSSRFSKSHKWGYFPSASLGWRVSEENFFKSIDKISNLKIRASWGKTGNTALSPYQSLATLNSLQVIFNDDLFIGYGPGAKKANPNLKWETTEQSDIGMDIGLFENKLSITMDYYNKRTFDLLSSVTLPPFTGYTSTTGNIGSIQNRGFEISSNVKVVKGLFDWNLSANVSINRSKVLSLSQGADIFNGYVDLPISSNVSIIRVGLPVGLFYGYKENGLDENGNIKYIDSDKNGTINSLDKVIIGNPNPKFIFGVNSFMTFNNFGLQVQISGVQGNDIFNAVNSFIADGFTFSENNIKDVLGNYWTKANPNPSAKYPRVSLNTKYQISDRFIEDGSYINIKNIQLSYTLKGDRFKFLPFSNSQIFLSAQNLITLTNYSGFSPEVNTVGGISKGIDQTGYPVARVIMLGVNLKL